MSWGSLFGSGWNTLVLGALWTLLGKFVEVLAKAFNRTITIIPTFQDAVNGFNMMQTAWIAIMVIIFLGIWINYIANSHAVSNQEV